MIDQIDKMLAAFHKKIDECLEENMSQDQAAREAMRAATLEQMEIPGQLRITEAGQEIYTGGEWRVVVPGAWVLKLKNIGYLGPYETGAMLDLLPIEVEEEIVDTGMTLTLYVTDAKTWRVGYVTYEAEGSSHIEAVANLMIEHPELWNK